MTAIATPKLEVTSEIKKLMRKADSVVVRSNHSDYATIEFQVGRNSIVSRTELALPIAIRAFDKMGASRTVCASLTSCSYSEQWLSILQVVKPGDKLSVYVVAGNNNQYLTKANLHHDEVYLQVDRKSGTIWMKLVGGVCEHNSARIVR